MDRPEFLAQAGHRERLAQQRADVRIEFIDFVHVIMNSAIHADAAAGAEVNCVLVVGVGGDLGKPVAYRKCPRKC